MSQIEQVDNPLFDDALRERWMPPEAMTPAEWAERHVVIPDGAARPGPLRHRNAPYLVGLLLLANAAGVRVLNIMKAGQIGVSAALRWLLGYWATQDPSPCGLLLPDKVKGEKIVAEDVHPFFDDTPVLEQQLVKKNVRLVRLATGFSVSLMWAGSASSTSADPLQRVICDEVDKMGAWGSGGGEGHAVFRVGTRLKTYEERGKQINVSTPTTQAGVIARLVRESRVNLKYLVPCPRCLRWIALVWTQIKFKRYAKRLERKEWAERIEVEDAAWYECQACGDTFSDRERRRAVQQGMYGTVDEHGIGDGVIERAEDRAEWPKGTTIGVHLPAYYCMWIKMSELAALYIEALGDLQKMYTFRTETQGEPFEQKLSTVSANVFAELSRTAEHAEGIVPWWASCLIATVDTQIDHFWLVIRAWGPGMRSQRILHRRVETEAQLDTLCFKTPYAVAGGEFRPMTCSQMLIDSGGTKHQTQDLSRTMQVYRYALERPHLVRAVKGSSKPLPGVFFKRTQGYYVPQSGSSIKREVPLWLLDTHHFQSELSELIKGRIVDRDDDGEAIREAVWFLNQNNDGEYNGHMSNMHLVAKPEGDNLVEGWEPITGNARIDFRDCEGYGVAGAYILGVNLIADDLEAWREYKAQEAQARDASRHAPAPSGITMPDGRDFIASHREP